MGNKQLRKIVGLFVILCSFTLRAQIVNGSFETNCGANVPMFGSCPSFVATCIPGWIITHGTPLISTTSGYDGTSSVLLWAGEGLSEGVGANLSTSISNGQAGSICFAYRVDNPEAIDATLRVRLTNGLTYTVTPGCGAAEPTTAFQEIVNINIPASTSGWLTVTATFTANATYSQMIVFPLSTDDFDQMPATVLVDDFHLATECINTVTVTQTSPSYTQSINQVGVIRAGSHVNGSTTSAYVTIDQSGLVEFEASQYITLEDNFLAIPGANDEAFLAQIHSCAFCSFGQSKQNVSLPFPINPDIEAIRGFGTIDVFPNPASDQITVSSKHGLKSVVLNDISGRPVMIFQPVMDENKQTFKLLNIKGGIYLLTLIDNSGKTETKKLIIE